MNALDWISSLPTNKWVGVRSSSQGVLDLVSEKNLRDGGQVVVRVKPHNEKAGWVMVRRVAGG